MFLFFSSFYFSLKFRDQNSTSVVQEEAGHVPQPSAKLEKCAPSAMEISSIALMESKDCDDDSATSGDPQSTGTHSAPSYVTYGFAPQSHVNQIEKSESHSQACAVSLNLDATKIFYFHMLAFVLWDFFLIAPSLFSQTRRRVACLFIIALRRKDQSIEPLNPHMRPES